VTVAEPTPDDGHAEPGATVGLGVNTTNSAVGQSPTRPLRPFRCLRHRAWMAACTDCREAHSIQIAQRHEQLPADAPR
jgi:hypothetical protein